MAVALPAVPARAAAAHPPVTLPGTEIRHLAAETNGVSYKLYVSLPKDYGSSDRRYGVVYLLDADYSFALARNVVEHLSDRDDLEPLILVGIAYDGPPAYRVNRTRDYTPRHVPDGGYGPEVQKHSGGGARFLRFLERELVPWVDREYRTRPGRRALVGHSYGGLFASWVLWTAPGTFDRYVVVSPSLWYDDQFLLKTPAKGLSKDGDPEGGVSEGGGSKGGGLKGGGSGAGPAVAPGTRVYLAVGSREGNRRTRMVEDLARFAARLEATGRVALRHEVPADETHNSVFPTALSRGLRWVFEGR